MRPCDTSPFVLQFKKNYEKAQDAAYATAGHTQKMNAK
jgi:hypothetical protein